MIYSNVKKKNKSRTLPPRNQWIEFLHICVKRNFKTYYYCCVSVTLYISAVISVNDNPGNNVCKRRNQ